MSEPLREPRRPVVTEVTMRTLAMTKAGWKVVKEITVDPRKEKR